MILKNIVDSLKSLWANISSINSKITDTGWQTATLTDEFKSYNNNTNNMPKFRRVGKTVQIWGIVSPSSTIAGGTTTHTIFTLPNGFRTSFNESFLCQGSGLRRWLLTVNSDGSVSFSRYGTEGYVDADANVWLPFAVTFFID